MTIFFPPYYNSYTDISESKEGDGTFIGQLEPYADHNTGVIFNVNYNEIDPGERASYWTYVWGFIQFYFQMPSSGRCAAVATLESGDSYIRGSLGDQIGSSSANVRQVSHFAMSMPSVNGLDRIEHELVNFHRGTVGFWRGDIESPGNSRQFGFVSLSTFSAGEWVLLTAEIFDRNMVYVNDFYSTALIQNHWILRSIDITSTV